MKQKIPIISIIILLLVIGIIQCKIFVFDKKKDNDGQVKSAQIDKNDFTIPEIDKIILPPIKNKNYINSAVWARNFILIDVNSAYPLAEKEAHIKVPIASTTKIMTAIIVLENYNLDDNITISKNAATQIGSDVYLRTNEQITIKNLLYALLIKSGNDAAMALAEKIGLESFINKMNQKAEYLGLENTKYQDPAGLNDSGFSTAKDLAILTSYALKNEEFNKIIKIPEITVISTDGKIAHKLESSNRLIKPDEILYYYSAIGVKTGFTPDAGHCLVAAAKKDNHLLVSVVLNTIENTKQASAKESRKLLKWGFDNFNWPE